MREQLTNMYEQRREQRQRSFKGGSISFNQASGLTCIVRNISSGGACLELDRPDQVPDQFDLVIKPEYVKRICRVRWKSENRVGVSFTRALDLALAARCPPQGARLGKL